MMTQTMIREHIERTEKLLEEARGQFSAAVDAEAVEADLRQQLQVLGSEMELVKCQHDKGSFAHELMKVCEHILSVAAAAKSTAYEAYKAALIASIGMQKDIIRSEEEILRLEDCCDLEEDFCEE